MTEHLSAARDHCLAPARAVDAPLAYWGKYDRLFADLPPLAEDEDAVLRLGASGGPCDAGPTDGEGEDANGPAGWPLFGQFVAHDITADRSTLQEHADPSSVRNFRTPRANLECLYGAGPVGSPFLYDRDDPAKLLIGENEAGRPDDIPRNSQGIGLIGDPRNDVHLFVSQLHLAMLKVHNGLVDRLRADGTPEGELFDDAARAAQWHYQWVIVHDFLPRLVGTELMADLLANGPRFYRPEGQAFIPFEFADAAYRYGHSQIRRRFRINDELGDLALFPDLIGFRPVDSAHTVDWAYMFELPGAATRPQPAKRIDGRLPESLIELPREITGEVDVEEYHSLAVRDLQRGHAIGLPSGEAVAAAMGEDPLAAERIGLDGGWGGGTPLWFYILKEAAALGGGERLGPVGGRIVAEVLVGIIDADPTSQRAIEPTWRPTLPASSNERFTLGDLLAFAGAG